VKSKLSGANFIAGTESAQGSERFFAKKAATGQPLETEFAVATADEIHAAVYEAERAPALTADQRSNLLEAIADELEAIGDDLTEIAGLETALPPGRLNGERGRTTGQLRMFAADLRAGLGQEVITDAALPDRQPAPRPEIQRRLVPIGPVAVFGASNFPLAFSVAGGDTASALAAGCPVVVKAHPLHPGTSELTAQAVYRALSRTETDPRWFSLLHGAAAVGSQLLDEPGLRAVAFTGSLRAGRALFDQANRRSTPIPVFAEMGSINPLFVLPGALADRGEALAAGYAESLLLGVGQFCTNPGVVIGIDSPEFTAFLQAVAEKLDAAPIGTMLSAGIAGNFQSGASRLGGRLAMLTSRDNSVAPRLFSASAQEFIGEAEIREECFGPAAIAVTAEDADELLAVIAALDGQLTGTIHLAESDASLAPEIATALGRKVGRLVFNGFPTGVEVGQAMQHGGPYPATTDSRFTSVGAQAIFRFLRPVAIQNAPVGLEFSL